MINYNISVNEELAEVVEKQISLLKYANRSEFFRDMIRTLFVEQDKCEIENISPNSSEYRRNKKILDNKDQFVSYSKLREKFDLS